MNPIEMITEPFDNLVQTVTPYTLAGLNNTIDWLDAHGFGWIIGAASPGGRHSGNNPCFDGTHFTC